MLTLRTEIKHALKDAGSTDNLVMATIIKSRRFEQIAKENDHFNGSEHGIFDSFSPAGFAEPRFTPHFWAVLPEHNTRLKQCISVIARNAVGLGASAEISQARRDETGNGRNRLQALQRDADKLQRLLDRPNDRADPINEVFFKVEYDFESFGNGYLEVVEDGRVAGGDPVSILHVPGVWVRVHKTGDKYVRALRSNKHIFFRRLGDENRDHAYIDRETGDFHTAWPPELPASRQGTALIHFKNYSPFDDFYGMPPVASAVDSVVGNKLQATWNINFLHNNAHIPLAIVVKNGNLHPDSMEQVELFVSREGKGIHNAGRIMVLQPDLKTMSQQGNIDIKLEPLKIGVSDDASFLKYRERNDAEIQEAFGIADILLGRGGGATRATANATKQITIEQVITPRALFWEAIFNSEVASRIGGGGAVLHLRRTTNLDALQEASIVQKLMPSLSVNDIRKLFRRLAQERDLPLSDHSMADLPMAILDKQVTALPDGEAESPSEDSVIQLPDAQKAISLIAG